MKHAFIFILLFAGITCAEKSFSQPVIQKQKDIGGSAYDELRGVYVTRDGGLIAGGISYSNKSGDKTQNIRGNSDYWVVKMDKTGKIQWDKTIGGNGSDNLKSLIQTSDGGYALVGESDSYTSVEKSEDSRGGFDYWLVKLDSLGNIQWDKTIGGGATELIDNLVQTSDGGFILGGSSDSYASGEKSEFSRGSLDMWVVKLNKYGTKIWDKTIGGSDYDLNSGVLITNDGGLILAGFSGSNASWEKSENNRGVQSDYWIVKMDQTGKIQWDKTIGGSVDDYARGIQQTSDGGYLVAGSSNSGISGEKTEFSRGGYDYWVVKLDGAGHVQKDKTIGGDSDDNEVWCLEKTSDGGFIFGGRSLSGISYEKTETNRGGFDYWVVKLDNAANMLWDKTVGGNSDETLYSIKEPAKNYYVLGGTSWSYISGDKTSDTKGLADYWIVLLNEKVTAGIRGTAADNISNEVNLKNYAKQLSVYPNPAKDVINIKLNCKADVSLADQSGKILLTKTVDGSGSINVSKFGAGVYYLRNNNDGISKKIIIAK